jgi:hypothetical protein
MLLADLDEVTGTFLGQSQAFAFNTQTALEPSPVNVHRSSLATDSRKHHLF